jgi:hypothetical protein
MGGIVDPLFELPTAHQMLEKVAEAEERRITNP